MQAAASARMSCTHLITGFSLVWAVVLLCFWTEAVSIKFPTSRVQSPPEGELDNTYLHKHVSREQSPAPGTVCVCEHAQSHVVGPAQKIAVNLAANPPVWRAHAATSLEDGVRGISTTAAHSMRVAPRG
ncbi:hypothetical protein J3F84DRAFT_233347 [Trichoderma pleuroticola]